MGWKFYGHAAVFGFPDDNRDIFAPGCFNEFLASPNYLAIPMLEAHDPNRKIGSWLRMHQDGYGLFVIGELNDDLPPFSRPFPGLPINPARSKGSPSFNAFGGNLCRLTWIEEISIVAIPSNPGARIMGAW